MNYIGEKITIRPPSIQPFCRRLKLLVIAYYFSMKLLHDLSFNQMRVKFTYCKYFVLYYSSSWSIGPPCLGLGPPALFAIIIWSTLRIVHAASVAYFKAQYFSVSRSNICLSTASVILSDWPSASILKQALGFPSWCAANNLEMTSDDLTPVTTSSVLEMFCHIWSYKCFFSLQNCNKGYGLYLCFQLRCVEQLEGH